MKIPKIILILTCLMLSCVTTNLWAQDAQPPRFDIYEYQVEGVSRLTDQAIEDAVIPFMGEQKSFSDVDAARAALERTYHEAGYMTVLVTIPVQKVEHGIVTLLANEVPVDKLKIANAHYHTPSSIRQQVPELAEGNVPDFNEMQKQLTALNRSPDLKATPILRAGQNPGSVEAELDIDDTLPVHGNLELSNRQSPNTSAMRLGGSIHYDNLFQAGQSLGLSAVVSPQKTDEVRVLSGTYVIPDGSVGNSWTMYGVISRSSLTTISNSPGLGVLGNTDILGLRYAMVLPELDGYAESLSVGPDWKHVKQLITSKAGNIDQPISYVPLVATYSGSVADEDRPTVLESTLTLGVRGLLGNTESEFEAKRNPGGSANFMVLRSDVQHTETFRKWKFFSRLEFQAASGPLVSTEQFTAGGSSSVRGYLEGELAADDALHASLEIRTPEFKPAGATSLWSMTGLTFWDGADLHTSYAQSPQMANQSIHSAGLGALLMAPRGFSLQVYWAHAYDTAQVTKAGSNRVQAHLEWDY